MSYIYCFSHPPCQLEWDMKLWWVHNEALIAFLMAYEHTIHKEHLERFAKLFDYSYSRVGKLKYYSSLAPLFPYSLLPSPSILSYPPLDIMVLAH